MADRPGPFFCGAKIERFLKSGGRAKGGEALTHKLVGWKSRAAVTEIAIVRGLVGVYGEGPSWLGNVDARRAASIPALELDEMTAGRRYCFWRGSVNL